MRTRINKTLLTLALYIFYLSAAGAVVPSQSIYKITINGDLHTIDQTGFSARVGDHYGVITALHGVAMCKKDGTINAITENGEVHELRLTHTDFRRDTALLTNPTLNQTTKHFFEVGQRYRSGQVEVFGYPIGFNTIRGGRPLTITQPPYQTLASYGIVMGLDHRNSPDKDVEMLNLDGNALPGDSGAPLIDKNGMVIGIVNGGINKGETGIAWAVPMADVELSPMNLQHEKIRALKTSGTWSGFGFSSKGQKPTDMAMQSGAPCALSDSDCWQTWLKEAKDSISNIPIEGICQNLKLNSDEMQKCRKIGKDYTGKKYNYIRDSHVFEEFCNRLPFDTRKRQICLASLPILLRNIVAVDGAVNNVIFQLQDLTSGSWCKQRGLTTNLDCNSAMRNTIKRINFDIAQNPMIDFDWMRKYH